MVAPSTARVEASLEVTNFATAAAIEEVLLCLQDRDIPKTYTRASLGYVGETLRGTYERDSDTDESVTDTEENRNEQERGVAEV